MVVLQLWANVSMVKGQGHDQCVYSQKAAGGVHEDNVVEVHMAAVSSRELNFVN